MTKTSLLMRLLVSRKEMEGARAEVRDELEKFGKNGKGYETRPGRTPRETLEENIMMILRSR